MGTVLKFEPRNTGWTRDDVNQVNKILESIGQSLPATATPNALTAPVSRAVPGTAGYVNNSQVPIVGNTTPNVNEKPGNTGPSSNPGTGITSVRTDGTTIGGNGVGTPIFLETPVAVANGGTGTATPGLIQGTGITITGAWPDQTINATGGSGNSYFPDNRTIADSPFSVPNTHPFYFLGASSSAGADFVANLPAATGSGNVLTIKRLDATAHTVTITPNGTDTIDGVNASDFLSRQYVAINYIDFAVGQWLRW